MNDYEPEINPLVSPVLGKSMVNLPPRDVNARGGIEICQSLRQLMGQKRDDVFIKEILAGNVPDTVRHLVPATILAGGNLLQYYVSPDVLSVGWNTPIRISLNGKSAKRLLDQINCMMPTKKMCDDIWRLADLKLSPRPMGASTNMMDTTTLMGHDDLIDRQVAGRPFTILTGHKKDTVICKYLLQDRTRTAIYGWFNPTTGVAIQGPGVQSSAHNWEYQDYSQSIRVVSRNALLNNQPIDLYEVLNDPQYAYLVSEESPYDASSIYT